MTISNSAKAAAKALPPDVLMHPMPFPERLDYAEKIIQQAINLEIENGRQWNALLELELSNLLFIKPMCHVCEQLMEQRGEDLTDYVCTNCNQLHHESQKMLAAAMVDRDALSKRHSALLAMVKMCYRKHVISDDGIRWKELEDTLINALRNDMGDEGYKKWAEAAKENL